MVKENPFTLNIPIPDLEEEIGNLFLLLGKKQIAILEALKPVNYF